MRYYYILGITIIAALLILFYDPYKDYLAVYGKEATIEYSQVEEGYEWVLTSTNKNLNINEINNNKWTISINKKGKTNLTASFINPETNDVKYKINYEFKNNGRKIFWLAAMGHGIDDFNNPY